MSMSISDVAREAGVSTATVSYVLNGKKCISQKTASKVMEAVERLGYRPKTSHRSDWNNAALSGKRIGFAINDSQFRLSNNPFYTRFSTFISEAVIALGGQAITTSFSSLAEDDLHNKNWFDGFLVLGAAIPEGLSVPYVCVLGNFFVHRPIADAFGPDDGHIGYLVSRYLYEHGHRHVGFVSPFMDSHPAGYMRYMGMCNDAQALGMKLSKFDCVFSEYYDDDPEYLKDFSEVPELVTLVDDFLKLEEKPTALFIPSDSHLVLIHNAFKSRGVKLGEELVLIGCNNEIPYLSALSPKPASVDLHLDDIAEMAVNKLAARIAGDRSPYSKMLIEAHIIEPPALKRDCPDKTEDLQ